MKFSIFLTCFALLACFEHFYPRRLIAQPKTARWGLHFFCLGIFQVFVIFLPALTSFEIARFAEAHKIGLFHWLGLELGALSVITGLIILDLALYWHHWLFHHFQWLYRFHRVHHSDVALDLSSALRFHPIEMALSLLYKAVVIVIFGIHPLVALSFDFLLMVMAMLNHVNWRWHPRVEALLRPIIVTPDYHRVHHDKNSQRMNLSFNLSLWDKLFKTYKPYQYQDDHKIELGLIEPLPYQTVSELLVQPWLEEKN